MPACQINIDKFLGFVELGIDFWEQAGKELVSLKAKDEDIFDVITEQCTWMNRDMLSVLERIGRKEIHPSTLLMPNHVLNRLVEMPYEQQRYLAEKPVVEVAMPRQGHLDNAVIEKRVSELTPKEARAVLSPQGVRSPKEQVKAVQPEVKPAPINTGKSLGLFQLTYMNGKLWVRQAQPNCKSPQRIVLTDNRALVELFQ